MIFVSFLSIFKNPNFEMRSCKYEVRSETIVALSL